MMVKRILFAVLGLGVLAASATAQSGSISGTVFGPHGTTPLAGIRIEIYTGSSGIGVGIFTGPT